jgi:hypothetical protein
MNPHATSRLDQALAKICLSCPVCRHARKTQAGAAFLFVKNAENGLCPFCGAYERVYGRKPHEPLAKAAADAP